MERRRPDRKPYYPNGFRNPNKTINQRRKLMKGKKEGRNLKSTKSQDYAQKPQ
jgi:hypothetical protein